MKKSLVSITAASLLFTSCFLESAKEEVEATSSSNSVLPASDALMYDLPSSVAPEAAPQSFGKMLSNIAESVEQAEEKTIWDAYAPVPQYIALAQSAKGHVKNFVDGLAQHNIPEKLDMIGDNGEHIVSTTRTETILGADQKIFEISITPKDMDVSALKLWYWKNARNQYLGSFTFRGFEGENEGSAVVVRFNNHNEAALGRRMTVLYMTDSTKQNDENTPGVIRVRSVKKDNKIWVSGASYHPTINEPFWEAYNADYSKGAIYAFQAATRTDKDHAVLRVALAPSTATKENLWSEFAIDKVYLGAGTQMIKTVGNTDTNGENIKKMILWSLENNKSLSQGDQSLLDYEYDQADWDALTPTDVDTYMNLNRALILNGEDKGFRDFYIMTQVEQPVFFEKNAKAVENVDAEFGLTVESLNAEEIDEVDPADVKDLDVDIESAEEEK